MRFLISNLLLLLLLLQRGGRWWRGGAERERNSTEHGHKSASRRAYTRPTTRAVLDLHCKPTKPTFPLNPTPVLLSKTNQTLSPPPFNLRSSSFQVLTALVFIRLLYSSPSLPCCQTPRRLLADPWHPAVVFYITPRPFFPPISPFF